MMGIVKNVTNANNIVPQNRMIGKKKALLKTGNSLIATLKKAENSNKVSLFYNKARILIVGYSPTGGGHTARTLNVVEKALEKGSLPPGSQVFIHVPPHWEGTSRPALIEELAKKLLAKRVVVKISESDKPVYGYLDKVTGGSNDAEILKRIALHPLRSEEQSGKNKFLGNYFPAKKNMKDQSEIKAYFPGDDLDALPRISARNLVKSIILSNKNNRDNIWILSDMDPGLQKAAYRYGIPGSQRVDQQNHAILLNSYRHEKNMVMSNALLAKVLDARGGKISHIALGGKNPLNEVVKTAEELGIGEKSTFEDGKKIINNIIFSVCRSDDETNRNIAIGGVLKGRGVNHPENIGKIIYVYAHKKTPIIAEHILRQIKNENKDYFNKVFIFCGKDAVPGYNAMHLAYLADADGITTAGAGTSGEFAYLHREAEAKSNLLILPIESHNEQEVIADALCSEFAGNVLRLELSEQLNSGGKIDELVSRKQDHGSEANSNYARLLKALNEKNTYVGQTYDILFGKSGMETKSELYQKIQSEMYNNPNMKATRKYLKLYFQLVNYFSQGEEIFPVTIKFKSGEPYAIKFDDVKGINELFNNTDALKKLLNINDDAVIDNLPLLKEVKEMMTSDRFPPTLDIINKLNNKLGHYMVTGF